MTLRRQANDSMNGISPGGFEFGIQGWSPGEPRPTTITFFLDGSAMVCDQHGYPIKGAVNNGVEVYFAVNPPAINRDAPIPYEPRYITVDKKRVKLGTHLQVIKALEEERIDWTKLTYAGTPQLPYEELKKVPNLRMAEEDELRRIPDVALRKDALRLMNEREEELAKRYEEGE